MTTVAADPFFEPQRQRRLRLMAQPAEARQAGLRAGSQSRIPGLGNTLLVIDWSRFAQGVGYQPSVRRERAAIVKVAK